MYGSGYVWIVSGATMYGGDLIGNAEGPDVMGCTQEELITASWGHSVVNFYTVSKTDAPTPSGKVRSPQMPLCAGRPVTYQFIMLQGI